MSRHFTNTLLTALLLSVATVRTAAGPVDFGQQYGVLSFEGGTFNVAEGQFVPNAAYAEYGAKR